MLTGDGDTTFNVDRRAFSLALGSVAVMWPLTAEAHVKWFAEYDLDKPPLPVGEVLTGQFLYIFLISIGWMYAFFLGGPLRVAQAHPGGHAAPLHGERARGIRGHALSRAHFLCGCGHHGISGHAFFLTPELKTGYRWVPWLQFGMSSCALHRYTVPLIGLGIAILYVSAIIQYGIFHLLDYLLLVGVSYYFLAVPMPGPGWLMSRYIILYATTGLTLLWAAIEKWAYPIWTYPVLAREPGLLMGFEPHTYMMLAGFFEFNVTFMALSSASLLSRAVTLTLVSIFLLAIVKFGMIDAVGHLLIIAILFVLIVRGPTKGRDFLVLEHKSLWTEAYFMTALYVLAFGLVFIAYYGFHFLAYGN